MREIKFRGRSIDTNVGDKWVYGGVLTTVYGEKNSRADIVNFDKDYLSFRNIRINENTLGQYTGIDDSNGKEVYEDDILRVFNTKTRQHEIGIVKMSNLGVWSILIDNLKVPIFEFIDNKLSIVHDTSRIEVIGNIHDNKDLLTTN